MDERALKEVVMEVIGREHCLDDAAIYPCADSLLVATTDMLHEQTDFPLGITDWQIGWMSIAVTLSDIAAMGARPGILLLAIGLDREARLTDIMKGAKDCADRFGAILAGGDLDHHQELTIVSSGIGFSRSGHIVKRAGSRPGDVIGITGRLGRAQAALEGYRRYEKDLFEPQPRVREGQILAGAGVTSMMDISDGLVLSLYDMTEANLCGYSIDSSLLPHLEGVPAEKSRELGLYGGGDFELLFTGPADLCTRVPDLDITLIGLVISEQMVRIDNSPAKRIGYIHSWD